MKKELPVKYYVENTASMADRHFHCHDQIMQPGSAIEPHLHDWVEILYCTEGRLRVFLGNSVVDFEKGDLVVIPINQVHFVGADGDAPSRYIVIKFSLDLLMSIAGESEYDFLLPFLLKGTPAEPIHTREPSQNEGNTVPEIGALLEHMLQEYNEKAYAYRLALRGDACALILFILRALRQQKKQFPRSCADDSDLFPLNKGATHVRRVFEAIDYIQKNYSNSITLDDMVKLLHVSYSYFSRQFSAVTGQSFAVYLCSVRLSAAEHLLITTDIPITEVAFQVGFSDASYFTRRFTAKNEITPGAYRKRYSVVTGER